MLTCQGCMRHCLQTIVGDSALLTAPSRPYLTSNLTKLPLTRRYTGTSYERSEAGQAKYRGRFDGRDSQNDKTREVKSNRASPRTIQRKQWLDSRGIRPPSKTEVREENTDRQIRQHLKYLNDPLKLADFVRKSLREDKFELAQEVVRAASKNALCVVSWNHLVEYQLSKGRMNAAIQTYNEMKKRAQTPDPVTYTILFKGCSEHPESSNALAKVLTIYNSMLTDKSPVKPNTIHMNCVLKMCSKAQDMDALLSVASQFPERGIKAPNNLSYTIILNAIRIYAVTGVRNSFSPMEKRQSHREAIANSRDIWLDVVARWRKADIWIDEELVASMGRLLLTGQEEDWDDIFSLIEQTMNIPRQVPKLGTPARQRIDPASQSKTHATQGFSRQLDIPAAIRIEQTQDSASVPSTKFDSFAVPTSKEDGLAMYAKPGPNTLSLILQATLNLGLKAVAASYWNIFTKSLLVQPDRENYHAYLRVLRLARASTETVEILLEMPKQDLETKTFRIAMSTCDRDKRNRNAFRNAGRIVDLMQVSLRQPDIQALQNYLNVAINAPAFDNERNTPLKQAQGQQILRALDRLNPAFINLKSAMQFGEHKNQHGRDEFVRDVLGLTRNMVSAYDHLMNKAFVPREMYGDLTKERSKLAALITRHQNIRGAATHSSVPAAEIGEQKEVDSETKGPESQAEIASVKDQHVLYRANDR